MFLSVLIGRACTCPLTILADIAPVENRKRKIMYNGESSMTDEELQQWVEHISLRDFGRPFGTPSYV